MKRSLTIMRGRSNSNFIAFNEKGDDPILTLYVPSKHHEEYHLPAITITIKGKAPIKKLYRVLISLDKKFDLASDMLLIRNNSVTTLSEAGDPLLFVIANGRGLTFIEPDEVSPTGYKPTKELVLAPEYLNGLYDLLQHVFGIPLSLRSKYVKGDDKESENEKVKNTGWQMIK